MSAAPSRRRTLRIAAVVAAVLVACALMEIVVRVAAPFPWYDEPTDVAAFVEPHPRFGWVGRPGLDGWFTQHEFQVRVRHNADGFRDDDFDSKRERAGERERVLVLGDSFAWGWGVGQDETVAAQLAALAPTVVTFNTGLPGYGTDQQLLVLRDLAARVEPDTVVLLLHPNDLISVGEDTTYGHPKPYFEIAGRDLALRNVPVPPPPEREPSTAPAEPGTPSLLDRAHLASWLRFTLRAPDPEPHLAAHEQAWTQNAALVTALLRAIQTECARRDARLLLVLVPTAEQLVGGGPRAAWQDGVAAAAAAAAIETLDLRPVLRGKPGVRFRMDRHWTPHGHRLVAEAVRDALGPRPR